MTTNERYLFSMPRDFRQIKYQANKNTSLKNIIISGHKTKQLDYCPVNLMFNKVIETDPDEIIQYGHTRLDLKQFPESLTVLTMAEDVNPMPLKYLAIIDKQLKKSMPRYHNDFCRFENKNSKRAISQSFFQTNFKIFRLTYCWTYKKNLILITLTVAEGECENGWRLLKEFAHSFKLL